MSTILEINDLSMHFGGLIAVDHVHMQIAEKEIVALIGPNGAGKTTLFNCVTGMYKPTMGNITVTHPVKRSPQSITGLRPDSINRHGVSRTFQNIRLFSEMSVLENVMIGRHTQLKSGILQAIFRPQSTRKEEAQVIEDSFAILKQIDIEKYANEIASNLPYGIQRRLEIARALASEPHVLLLDEPAAGMNPHETKELCELIVHIHATKKITIFLIEHDMNVVMNLAERIYVMDYGKLLATGSPDEIKNNPAVIEAYLGDTSYA